MLDIKQVTKTFNQMMILNHVSLKIEKDNIVGLAGPSGGGKSTLLRCIQGLESIDSGSIECDGQTGFMFQDFQLFPHFTVLENLIYAPKLKNRRFDHQKQALAILENLGINHKYNEYPHNLSGGQKQRVALARSLMMKPDLLLCDEPTSGLDVATIQDVVSLLASVKDKGVAMIIASHDLDFLTNIADRIVVLKGGSIIVDAKVSTLVDPINDLKKYY